MKLIVVKLPDKVLAFTNLVYLNPGDVSTLSGGAKELMVRAGGATFSVQAHDAIPASSCGTNSFQRAAMGAAVGEQTEFEVVQAAQFSVVANLELSVSKKSKTRATMTEDDLIAEFKRRVGGHVLSTGQRMPVVVGGATYILTVARLTTLAAAEDERKRSGGAKGGSSCGLVLKTTSVSAPDPHLPQLAYTARPAPPIRSVDPERLAELGVGGLDTEFSQVFRRAFASRMLDPAEVRAMGIKHAKGVLLYGPPGTGKTLIARTIAGLLSQRPPKIISGPEVLDKYVGEAEKRVRELFQEAEEDAAENGDNADLHVIIIDELDAICRARGSSTSNLGDSVVNQLLTKMDGVEGSSNVLLIGMTNRKTLLDPALLRPGRLEVQVRIGLPDEAGRLAIFGIHTKAMRENGSLGPGVSLDWLAGATKNFSGAEIAGLVRNASSFAMYNLVRSRLGQSSVDPNDKKGKKKAAGAAVAGKMVVTVDDFARALSETVPAHGVAEEDLKAARRGGFVPYPECDEICRSVKLAMARVQKGAPKATLCLVGPAGVGKTTIAAELAAGSDFPFVKVLSASELLGRPAQDASRKISEIFREAGESEQSMIVLDDIERLVRYVPSNPPRFAETIVDALLVLLEAVPRSGRMFVIATTRHKHVLGDLGLLDAFDSLVRVSPLQRKKQLLHILQHGAGNTPEQKERQAAGLSGDDEAKGGGSGSGGGGEASWFGLDEAVAAKIAESCPLPIPIKQVGTLLEMARAQDERVTVDAFMECAERAGLVGVGEMTARLMDELRPGGK